VKNPFCVKTRNLFSILCVGLLAACAAEQDLPDDELAAGGKADHIDDDESPLPVTFALGRPTAVRWDVFIAEYRGYFAMEGVAPEFIEMDPEEILAAVGSGEVVMGAVATANAMLNQNDGLPLTTVMLRNYGLLQEIAATNDIATVADFAGKTIWGGPNPLYPLILAEIFGAAGLTQGADCAALGPTEYCFEEVSSSSKRFDALHDGEVDAVILAPPFNLTIDPAVAHILASFPDVFELAAEGNIANTDHLTDPTTREAVVRVTRALIRAQRFLNHRRNASVLVLQTKLGISKAEARATYDFVVEDAEAFAGEGEVTEDAMRTTLELLGLDPDAWESFADLSIYEDAIDY
jgi:ABC-type nitrate/sulfonate/bicarbonate transport system substrate-binding protein